MYSQSTVVINPSGLHARPASTFVQAAKSFNSKVQIRRADSEDAVNAKSMIMVLSQGICMGTEVFVTAEGEDEQLAVEELIKLIDTGFDEV